MSHLKIDKYNKEIEGDKDVSGVQNRNSSNRRTKTEEQKKIINRTIGVARFVKNFYIYHNQEVYKSGGSKLFMRSQRNMRLWRQKKPLEIFFKEKLIFLNLKRRSTKMY